MQKAKETQQIKVLRKEYYIKAFIKPFEAPQRIVKKTI